MYTSLANTPCIKFRKYFEMRQCQKICCKSFNMEVYEKYFLAEVLVFQVAREKNKFYNISGYKLSLLLVRRFDLC